MEKLFEATGCNEREKIVFAKFRMEEDAEIWWKTIETKWARDGTRYTWSNFLKDFNKQYVPQSVRDKRELDFMNLVQGKMSVALFVVKLQSYQDFILIW